MTLFETHITTTSSSPSSSTPPSGSAAYADHWQKGTQIHTGTLRERRGVAWFIHFEPCTLAGANDDAELAQPQGHLQPTVMNMTPPHRRRVPAKAAPIIPTPLSSPCTPLSSSYVDHEGTQNLSRTPHARCGVTSSIYFERAQLEESEWQRGVARPVGQLQLPLMKRCGRGKEVTAPVPQPPLEEWQRGVVRPVGQLQLPLMKRCGRGKEVSALVPQPPTPLLSLCTGLGSTISELELNSRQSLPLTASRTHRY